MQGYGNKGGGGGGYYKQDAPQLPDLPKFQSVWIEKGVVIDTIDYCKVLGQRLNAKKFTTTQFRNFYGELKRIQLNGIKDNKASFLLLTPKLAYATKRANSKGADEFKDEMNKAMAAVINDARAVDEARFAHFCDFVEAVLAFHKAEGGQ